MSKSWINSPGRARAAVQPRSSVWRIGLLGSLMSFPLHPRSPTIERLLTTFPLHRLPDAPDGARFVHNLDVPLLDQVALEAPSNTTEIVITSPFHQRRLRPVTAIAGLHPRAKIVVAQGTLDGTTDATAVPTSLKKRITTAICSTRGRERRAWPGLSRPAERRRCHLMLFCRE